MLHVEGKKGVGICDGLTRRDFLRAGALGAGAVGLTLADLARLGAAGSDGPRCILLFLVGGPGQLDTWDPKPDAPAEVRGPFRPARTSVPGIDVCEHFPLMARLADRYSVVRSVHHDAAPIHETGQQLLQTGRLCRGGVESPHYGAALSYLRGPGAGGAPAWAVLPAPVGNTGVSVSHGQGAGFLGGAHEPVVLRGDPAHPSGPLTLSQAADQAQRALDAGGGPTDEAAGRAYDRLFSPRAKQALDVAAEPANLRERYGRNTFGQSCLLARRLVEAGVRLVTVNMFDTVFNEITWDCHADGGALATTLDDYKDILCPMFDRAYSTLLEDLGQRGLLGTTLVLAMGEFGRTPRLNPRGGRDHWPGCWSVLLAGGGVRGGRVVGASDAHGAEPRDRPVTPAELAASVYAALGLDPRTPLPGPEGRPVPLADAEPVAELF
jgi:uncharacterized protein (DUF1501 family)